MILSTGLEPHREDEEFLEVGAGGQSAWPVLRDGGQVNQPESVLSK